VLLTEVSIEGFRSILSVERLQIASPTLLAGHNASGKTSVLDAVRLLLGAYRAVESDYTLLQVDEQEPAATDADEVSGGRVADIVVTGAFVVTDRDSLERASGELVRLRRVVPRTGPARLELEADAPDDDRLRDFETANNADLSERIVQLSLRKRGTTKAAMLEVLREAASAAPSSRRWIVASKELEAAMPQVSLFDASSIADVDVAIRDGLQASYRDHVESPPLKMKVGLIEAELQASLEADVAALQAHMQERLGDEGHVMVSPQVSLRGHLGETQVSLKNGNGETVPLSAVGTGRARRMAFAVWEFTSARLSEAERDVILLYDEPDTHLDYQRQRAFMHLILEQALHENVRIVIATHSMNLIDGVDIGDVVHVQHDENLRTTISTLADDSETGSHLGDIASSLGLRNTVLLHERLFLGVEGATEAQALPVLFKLAMGRHLESCGIAIWSCDNHEGAVKFARYLHEHGREVAFLVDADARSVTHVFSDASLRKAGLEPDIHCFYVGAPNELEDVFSSETWADVANKRWPRVNDGIWNEQDIEALRDKGKFSDSLLELFKVGSESGPRSKPEMMTTLALVLRQDQVPEQLLDRFERISERAS
jgi:putative ATP-dependent endonuclease of OLD family